MQVRKFLVSALVFGSLTLTGSAAWGQTYYVQPGDSLYNIAARYGTTVSSLVQANGLSNSQIYPGQALNITAPNAGSSSGFNYTVRPGDTLYLLSQKYGVSVNALKQANNLSGSTLWVGQQLKIPGPAVSGGSSATYRVQAGDSLYLVAQRYGISVDDLRRANNLSYDGTIYPGQVLTIPKTSSNTGVVNYYGFQLSQGDIDLLARLVTAESDGEPFEGQVAVAATILNRLRDPRYPKSIPGIIYQVDNGSYQYSPVLDGRINQPASASAYRAVQSACSGWDPSNGANGFYNPSKTTNQWVRSHPETAVIGNHVFFSY
ncbi:MAG: LysM peptidoglycan-binding domain-containing protein [Bacillota bacterium]